MENLISNCSGSESHRNLDSKSFSRLKPGTPQYTWLSASSLASRKAIEDSSYTTTAPQSPGAPTPPSGQVSYKPCLDKTGLDTVDSKLIDQTTDKVQPPNTDRCSDKCRDCIIKAGSGNRKRAPDTRKAPCEVSSECLLELTCYSSHYR